MQYIYFLVEIVFFSKFDPGESYMKHILDILLENCYKIVR